MPISKNDGRAPLAEARFTARRHHRRSSASLCDGLVIDPCGCIVNPCACFRTDTAGCNQDCGCEQAHHPRLP